MAKEKVTAKLIRIASTGKGFQLEGFDGWFNATDKSKVYLEKIEVGTIVDVDYFSKGTFRTAIVIAQAKSQEQIKPEVKQETKPAEYKCSVCGKVLKDGKYPTCWDCKNASTQAKPLEQKKLEEKKVDPPKQKEPSKVVYTCKICGKELKDNKYDVCFNCKNATNDTKQSAIQRGNALNAAAMAVSGNLVQIDPVTIAEVVRTLANEFLEWLRIE